MDDKSEQLQTEVTALRDKVRELVDRVEYAKDRELGLRCELQAQTHVFAGVLLSVGHPVEVSHAFIEAGPSGCPTKIRGRNDHGRAVMVFTAERLDLQEPPCRAN